MKSITGAYSLVFGFGRGLGLSSNNSFSPFRRYVRADYNVSDEKIILLPDRGATAPMDTDAEGRNTTGGGVAGGSGGDDGQEAPVPTPRQKSGRTTNKVLLSSLQVRLDDLEGDLTAEKETSADLLARVRMLEAAMAELKS